MASLRTAKRKAQRRRLKARMVTVVDNDILTAITKRQYVDSVVEMLAETMVLYNKVYRR